jgi:AcrR family transcriptional regulator
MRRAGSHGEDAVQAQSGEFIETDRPVIIIYQQVNLILTRRPERQTRGLMKTKKDVVSEFRRTEIVDAARSVFARKGFARGIMDEIANQARIAKGTIYLYFRSKDEIYRAVLDHDMESLNKVTLERIDAAKGLKDKIRAFTLARMENAEVRKEFFRIMDTEAGSISFTRKQYRDWIREPVLRLAYAIEDASRRNEIRRVPPEKVAWMIADLTRGAIQRRLLEQDDIPPGEDAEFLSSFIWAALAVEAPR